MSNPSQTNSFLEKSQNSVFSYFVKNTKIAFLGVTIILFLGIVSYLVIPKESAPKIEFGMAVVSTFYDGASAMDIDKLVTQEIENKIKDVNNISKINSSSRNSFSSISIEFETGTNMTKAMGDLRSKIDEAKAKIPSDAEDPTIIEIDSTMDPIFTANLTANLHPVLLKDYAEKLKTYLEQDSVIKEVTISGGAEREIFVDADPLKISQYRISLLEIINAIKQSHQDFPVGDFAIDELNYSLRFQGQHQSSQDIGNIILRAINNNNSTSVIKISDIANVYESNEKIDSIETYIDVEGGDLERTLAVKLNIKKSGSTDIFKVDPYIRKKISDYIGKKLNNEVQVFYTNETIEHTRDSYETVMSNGISSFITVLIVLMLFIGWKEALVASIIIPLSFLITITCIKATGGTLNFLINFSLILSLGILVDNAIVIVEGIYAGIKDGYTPKESAMMAVYEFKAPLISSTLTTLAVFIPLFVLPGILGKYLSYIPIAVFLTLLASLFISLIIIPAVASSFLKPKIEHQEQPFILTKIAQTYHSTRERLVGRLEKLYGALTNKMLSKTIWRASWFYGTLILCVLTFLLPIKFIMFPSDDSMILYVNVKLAEGSTKEETLKATLPVEKILLDIPELRRISTSINNNTASINLEFYKKEERDAKGLRRSNDIAESLRVQFKQFKTYEVDISEPQGGPPSEAPVAFKVIAEDTNVLDLAQKTAQDLKEILKTIPGTDNIKDDLTNIPGEITYHLNREEALRLGVEPSSVMFLVRTAINGSDAITLTREGREINVKVRYPENYINNFDDIDNIQVINNRGEAISLSQIVDRKLNSALSEIKRRDRKIAITVSSQLTKTGNALEITEAMKTKIANYQFPEGVYIEDAGENAENKDLFIALGVGFLVAVFLMFTILVIQFNSYIYPFIILFTIMMSLLGVNIGLFATGTPRSLAFIIGFISLAGIVVNDAIVLIDQINNLRAKYPEWPLEKVIAQAGATRLQPIFLTTLTTVAGIAPLVYVDTFWAGLAYTIVFGLSMATMLTLFVTPCMYYQFTKYLYKSIYRFVLFVNVIIIFIIGFTASSVSAKIIGDVIFLLIFIVIFYFYRRHHKKCLSIKLS